MATVKGVNATKIAASPAQLAEDGEQNCGIKIIYDQYTLTAALSTNDVISMGGLIPAGSRVIDVLVDSADLDSGANGILDVGWAASADAVEAADDDGFLAAVNASVKIGTSMSSKAQADVPGKMKAFSSAVQAQVKIKTAGDGSSGSIRLAILYL